MLRVGQRVTVTARTLDETGRGVGEAAGAEVWVADLLPGERAEVAVVHRSRHRPRAWADIAARSGPLSAERVAPVCPGFGRCGGCAWQHLGYAAQLLHKRERVRAALVDAGVDGAAAIAAPLGADAITGYRSKGVYVIGASPDDDGAVALGAYEPRTHRLVDTLGCQVVEPALARSARAARDAIAEAGLAVYDERTRAGYARYWVARSGTAGEVAAALVTTSAAPPDRVAAVAEAVVARGAAAGVLWVKNDTDGGGVFAADRAPIAGDPTVVERVAGVDIRLGPADFFQVHRAQAARLFATVAALAEVGPGSRALDLYCGVGPIAYTLARAGATVLGIERAPEAIGRARAAAQSASLPGSVAFAVGDAAGAVALVDQLAAGSAHALDAVVVNPPRKGLSAAARDALAQLAAPRVIYVSCEPTTLARDVAALSAAGYALDRAIPLDLMPGTAHIETIARLKRA